MAPIATSDNVSDRLGRALSNAESAQADAVIATVTGLIADAAGVTVAALEQLAPLPQTFKTLCIEKATMTVVNPQGLAAQSEQLGAHQQSSTFQRANDGGVYLTDSEERRVRRVLRGTSFTAVTLETPFSGPAVPESDLPL
jgi:hypothetical protein